MKEKFQDLHLSLSNIRKLEIINEIIEDYASQGYRMSLRQLYYQLVSSAIIPNTKSEYSRLSNLIVAGRMAGIVDWDSIVDRLRQPQLPYWAIDIPDALNDLIEGRYRVNRQWGQGNYIEVWVEKDALSEVLLPITEKYHVNLLVNRGYSSASALHDAAERFKIYEKHGIKVRIIQIGDHDPSGIDMDRDNRDRLVAFGVNPYIQRVALTDEQIEQYNPPPNPAKITDPRASKYIAKYGEISWEVDALHPSVLNDLVTDAIKSLIDLKQFEKMLEQEGTDIARLKELKEEEIKGEQ